MALEVPLAINLQRRVQAELETQALTQAQTVAAAVGPLLSPEGREELQQLVVRAGERANGRVIVVGSDGRLLADSSGEALLGTEYATPDRPEILAALAAPSHADSRVRHSETLNEDLLVTAVPILEEGRATGAVRVSLSMEQVSANAGRVLLALVAIGAAGLVAGLLIAFVVAGSLSRPLRRLADTAERLGAGDLSSRTGPVIAAREIEEVAAEFDEMAERLESTVRAQGEFAANASHQLRTPLTGLRLRLESAVQDASPELRPELEAAQREVDRLAAIVERLLVLARGRERPEAAPVDVRSAAERAVERWDARARAAGASIEARGVGGQAAAEPGDVDQILDALIDNGLSHGRGPVVVESGASDGRVFVAVEDHGPGIPEPDRGRVTERFYRSKGAPSGGSGLGLSIVRELAERWGGALEVGAATGGGARLEVRFPPATQP